MISDFIYSVDILKAFVHFVNSHWIVIFLMDNIILFEVFQIRKIKQKFVKEILIQFVYLIKFHYLKHSLSVFIKK